MDVAQPTLPWQRGIEWQYVAPRLYLDTCMLIDALLEAPQVPSATGHEREIYLAQRVFEKWPPGNLIVSPYVIGEFIQKGQAKYGRTLDDMRNIVSNQILRDKFGWPRCRVAFAKFDVPLTNAYAAAGLDASYMMTLGFHGTAKDDSGRAFPGARVWIQASRTGKISSGIMTGLPAGTDSSAIPDPGSVRFGPDAEAHVEAPAYEFLLFDSAARLVTETGVNWKDVFHYLYARWETADSILTTDRGLIDQSSRNRNLPIAETPSSLKARLKDHGGYGRVHDLVFGPCDG